MSEAENDGEAATGLARQAALGRNLLLYVFAVAAVAIAVDVYVFSMLADAARPGYLARMLIRNAIMVLVLLAVWAGYNAARYVMGVLFLLGSLFSISLLGKDALFLVTLGASMTILMGSAAMILLFSTSLGEFIRQRRTGD